MGVRVSGHPIHHNPKAISHVEMNPFTRHQGTMATLILPSAGRIISEIRHCGN